MTLNELIEKLQGLQEEHGEHEVWIVDSYGNCNDSPVGNIRAFAKSISIFANMLNED